MADIASPQAAAGYPVSSYQGKQVVQIGYGVAEAAAAQSATDTVDFCNLPACEVIDGFLRGDDIDTGTEAFELDIGHTANGTESADPDAFLNSGVITGDAVTEVKPETQIWMPLNGVLKDGPYTLSAKTLIQGTVVAAANAGGTGTMYAGLYYITS